MQEAGLATPQGLLRIRAPAKETPLLLRLRCYLPSTSATLLILAAAFIAFHSAASHTFAPLGLATEIVIGVGLAGLAAGTIVISAVTIQRRRAAAGACHTCSHPCRGAMVPLPERDAQLWPHRPLTQQPARPLLVVLAGPAPTGGGQSPDLPCASGTPEPQRLRDRSYPARQTTFAGPA